MTSSQSGAAEAASTSEAARQGNNFARLHFGAQYHCFRRHMGPLLLPRYASRFAGVRREPPEPRLKHEKQSL